MEKKNGVDRVFWLTGWRIGGNLRGDDATVSEANPGEKDEDELTE